MLMETNDKAQLAQDIFPLQAVLLTGIRVN